MGRIWQSWRAWLRFSLRSVLILTTVVALSLAHELRGLRRRQAAYETLSGWASVSRTPPPGLAAKHGGPLGTRSTWAVQQGGTVGKVGGANIAVQTERPLDFLRLLPLRLRVRFAAAAAPGALDSCGRVIFHVGAPQDVLVAVGALPETQSIEATGKMVDDAVVKRWSRCRMLKVLRLHDVGVSDQGLQAVAKLPELQELFIESAAIKGPGLEFLRDLSRLRKLTLADADLSTWQPTTRQSFPAIHELALAACRVDRAAIDSLTRGYPACALALRDCDLKDDALAGLVDFRGSLTLEACRFSESDWKLPPALRDLRMIRMELADDTMRRLFESHGLVGLSIFRANLPLTEIRRLKGLRSLEIGNRELDQSDVTALAALETLQELSITACPLAHLELDAFSRMPSLKKLVLRGTGTSKTTVARIQTTRPELTIEAQ
ncbi:MAG: hypothetical protein K1X74_16955 [Pirellulales bacterium]|nr:hypothetical protein [Pirellulales bacterium]